LNAPNDSNAIKILKEQFRVPRGKMNLNFNVTHTSEKLKSMENIAQIACGIK
jgi:hypothetical protein